jgi:hypothetical protein
MSRFLHFEPRALFVLLPVQHKILVRSEPQTFAPAHVVVLVQLRCEQNPKPRLPAHVGEPIGDAAVMVVLALRFALAGDTLQEIDDDPADALQSSPCDDPAQFVEAGARGVFVKRVVGNGRDILSDRCA